MTQLDHLAQIADRSLGGLHATPEMRYQIQMKALKQEKAQKRSVYATRVAAVCCCGVLLLALLAFPHGTVPNATTGVPTITSMPMGQNVVAQNEETLVSLKGEVSASNRSSDIIGIWETSQSGTFPLISVKGAYYRLLSQPEQVTSSLRGGRIGTIDEFTSEPSLSDASILSSNCVSAGSDVYAVDGFAGTFVTASVNGTDRLFQRVSFNGRSTLGNETLEDTLSLASHVSSMTLSGAGTVSDPALCQSLLRTLFDQASFDSANTVSASNTLLITLDNGLNAQMLVREDKLSACGTWSCPEFMDAFMKALQ